MYLTSAYVVKYLSLFLLLPEMFSILLFTGVELYGDGEY